MDVVELIKELVKYQSVNPGGGVWIRECANYIREVLKQQGFSPYLTEYEKGYPIVVASNGKKGREVVLNGHFDVVPAGEESSWLYPPFSGKLVEGKIYGRGSTDMKGGLAVYLSVFSEIAEKVDYRLTFTAVSDEEIGGYKGTYPISKELNPFLVLVGEPTGAERVIIGEKGTFQVKLTSRGKVSHGSRPSLGENAIMKLFDDITTIKGLERVEGKLNQEIVEGMRDYSEEFLREALRVTVNVGVIKGGLKVNVVPDYAEAEIDIRIPPGVTVNEVKDLLEGKIRSKLEVTNSSEPTLTETKNYYVRAMKESIKRVTGKEAKAMISTYATDGRFFRYKSLPVIVYGPGELELLHSYNEYVRVEDVVLSGRVLKDFLLNIKNAY